MPGTLQFLGTVRVGGERVGGAGSRRLDIGLGEVRDVELPATAATLPLYRLRRPARFIDGIADFEAICRELAGAFVAALDVETTLDTHSLCLIQLAVDSRVIIIDPLALPSIEPLRVVLENDSITKVGRSCTTPHLSAAYSLA